MTEHRESIPARIERGDRRVVRHLFQRGTNLVAVHEREDVSRRLAQHRVERFAKMRRRLGVR